jgi:hypothetical protein
MRVFLTARVFSGVHALGNSPVLRAHHPRNRRVEPEFLKNGGHDKALCPPYAGSLLFFAVKLGNRII